MLVNSNLLEFRNTQTPLLKLRVEEERNDTEKDALEVVGFKVGFSDDKKEISQWKNLVQEPRAADPSAFKNSHNLNRDFF